MADGGTSPQGANTGAPPRKPTEWRTAVIVILAVCLFLMAVMFASCAVACYGCSSTVNSAFEDSLSMEMWGWKRGLGPAPQGTTLSLGTKPEPRDTQPRDAGKDDQLEKNLAAIYAGLEAYKAEHGDYPSAHGSDLGVALAPYVSPWPTNPWTGDAMVRGDHRGDFQYEDWQSGIDLLVVLSAAQSQ